jgi:hypothetical protein
VLVDKFLPGEFEPPAFALRLGHKDVSLAHRARARARVPMRLANLALEEITEASTGLGPRDSSSFMLLEEERAGVHIAVRASGCSRSGTRTAEMRRGGLPIALAALLAAPAGRRWRGPRGEPSLAREAYVRGLGTDRDAEGTSQQAVDGLLREAGTAGPSGRRFG